MLLGLLARESGWVCLRRHLRERAVRATVFAGTHPTYVDLLLTRQARVLADAGYIEVGSDWRGGDWTGYADGAIPHRLGRRIPRCFRVTARGRRAWREARARLAAAGLDVTLPEDSAHRRRSLRDAISRIQAGTSQHRPKFRPETEITE